MNRYLIALGSNVRHARHGPPAAVLRAALRRLDEAPGIALKSAAPILASAPLGTFPVQNPSPRRGEDGWGGTALPSTRGLAASLPHPNPSPPGRGNSVKKGPLGRRYANTVAVVKSKLSPPDLLERMKAIEAEFGRRSGQRWSARVLDLDVILWSGGPWSSPGLTVPHPAFRQRNFVLAPALAVAANWRDPLTGLTIRHLHVRLMRPRPRGA